jgi:hypothetical protein
MISWCRRFCSTAGLVVPASHHGLLSADATSEPHAAGAVTAGRCEAYLEGHLPPQHVTQAKGQVKGTKLDGEV